MGKFFKKMAATFLDAAAACLVFLRNYFAELALRTKRTDIP